MAVQLQIKRSTGSSAPGSLADGELAYTKGDNKFYIGDGSSVRLIGGKAFNDLIDHTAGTLTAGSAILVDSNKAIDDLIVGNNATTGGSLELKEGTNNGTHHVQLKAPNTLSGNIEFTLPKEYIHFGLSATTIHVNKKSLKEENQGGITLLVNPGYYSGIVSLKIKLRSNLDNDFKISPIYLKHEIEMHPDGASTTYLFEYIFPKLEKNNLKNKKQILWNNLGKYIYFNNIILNINNTNQYLSII